MTQAQLDPHLRMVRAVKNRYGAADEVGCFELTEDGIAGVTDPSGLFLSRAGASGEPVAGTCVTVAMEGRRPLVGSRGRAPRLPPYPRLVTASHQGQVPGCWT